MVFALLLKLKNKFKIIILLFLLLPLFGQEKYDRSQWGVWQTYKGCINIREQMLIQTSKTPVSYSNDGCSVIKGWWELPFENIIETNPKKIDIDHTVPLSWVQKHGGDKWDKEVKIAFANNIEEFGVLLPMSARNNRTKGDRGPDEWMPPFNRCNYIKLFKKIINKNNLILSNKEKQSFKNIIKKECN